MKKINPIVNSWILKAQNDEKAVEAIIKEKASPDVACFLSQQLTEKAMKALLIYYSKKAPKIHNLLELEKLILPYNSEIRNFEDNIDLLNQYYIESRYPDDFSVNLSWKDAKQAFKAAQKIKDFVVDILL